MKTERRESRSGGVKKSLNFFKGNNFLGLNFYGSIMMKKYFYYILFALLSSGAIQGNGANLLVNGDFESGKSSWQVSEWSKPQGKVEFTVTEEGKHSGNLCAQVRHLSGGENIVLGQKLSIEGRKNLRLTFYAKAAVPVNVNVPISASFVTVDKSGKKLQYEIKRFTASDRWEEFSWQFSTHPDTAKLDVYLRNGKTTTWYDDVNLEEFSGINISEIQIWYPSREVIPTISRAEHVDAPKDITITVTDSTGKEKLYETKLELTQNTTRPILPLQSIGSGEWHLRTSDSAGRLTDTTFIWPAEPKAQTGRRNNFVTVLYSSSSLPISPEKPLEFTNPRTGWLFLKLTSRNDGALRTPHTSGEPIKLKANIPTEVMRYAAQGKIELRSDTPLVLSECEVRTMPELIFCEYESMESRKHYHPLMKSPAIQSILANTNVIMEGFVNGYTMNAETMSAADTERIVKWRASGRQLISHAMRSTEKSAISLNDTLQYWITRIGMTQFDGIAIDEFGNETVQELPAYTSAQKAINANPAVRDKRIYAYSCPAWNTHAKSVDFRQALIDGNGIFATEYYLREKRSIAEAKSHINFMFQYLRDWEQNIPGSFPRTVVVLSCTDGLSSYYGQDTFADVLYKYYLDLQYNLLANDPAFDNLRGLSMWILRYARPETIAWLAALNRHYCIEGNRDLLSKRHGFDYQLNHLVNPDFTAGIEGWELYPAGQNTIVPTKIPGWGFGRGTCNTAPDGDDVLLLKRIPGKTNIVRQKIRNLQPGQWYELRCRVADYDDIQNGIRKRKLLPLNMQISGITPNPKLSFIDVYQSDHTMPPKFPAGKRNNGPCANEQRLVFQATAADAELTISDDAVTHGIQAGNNTDAPFLSPHPEEVGGMILNFIQLQPILPPEQWEVKR